MCTEPNFPNKRIFFFLDAQSIAIQEQSTLVKRFIDVKKTLQDGDINAGKFGETRNLVAS